MKKNIKDYLHLYLGCEVSVTNLDGRFRRINNYDFFSEYYDWDEGQFMNDPKLILRPLSSMTHDEAKDFLKFDNKIDRITSLGIFYCVTGVYSPYAKYFEFITPQEFLWLLSRGFDVFNLIPEGLAIDATTLKTEE